LHHHDDGRAVATVTVVDALATVSADAAGAATAARPNATAADATITPILFDRTFIEPLLECEPEKRVVLPFERCRPRITDLFGRGIERVRGEGRYSLVDGRAAHFTIPSGSPRRETVVDRRMAPVDHAASSCRVIAAPPAAPDSVPTCRCADQRSSRAPSSSGSSR
jgi:hypothetical protein